jgi:hypothetical protein
MLSVSIPHWIFTAGGVRLSAVIKRWWPFRHLLLQLSPLLLLLLVPMLVPLLLLLLLLCLLLLQLSQLSLHVLHHLHHVHHHAQLTTVWLTPHSEVV